MLKSGKGKKKKSLMKALRDRDQFPGGTLSPFKGLRVRARNDTALMIQRSVGAS